MPFRRSHFRSLPAGLLLGALGCVCGFGNGTPSDADSVSSAAAAVGKGDRVTLDLIRELSEWRERALGAELLLAGSGVRPESVAAPAKAAASVVASIESERAVIVSAGRRSGAVLGAVISIGGGVVARVVESREDVSAALVEKSFKGKVSALEGSQVRVAVR